jgi:hypothetical protein
VTINKNATDVKICFGIFAGWPAPGDTGQRLALLASCPTTALWETATLQIRMNLGAMNRAIGAPGIARQGSTWLATRRGNARRSRFADEPSALLQYLPLKKLRTIRPGTSFPQTSARHCETLEDWLFDEVFAEGCRGTPDIRCFIKRAC